MSITSAAAEKQNVATSMSPGMRSRSGSTLDVLCIAYAQYPGEPSKLNIADLAVKEESVMEFCIKVCSNIIQARQHLSGKKTSEDSDVVNIYVPWLRAVLDKQVNSSTTERMLSTSIPTICNSV